MQRTCEFQSCLSYSSPARGGWSIVRMALQVPESHLLFVGAAACMRHIMLSSIELKIDHRVSWLSIEERDIISGGYEQLILETVDEMLSAMSPRPKMFMIFTTCIDNLLGTDHSAFLDPLNEKYPGTRCTVGFMNPITSDGPLPPAIHMQDSMYELLDTVTEHDGGVNFIGDNLAINPENELIRYLTSKNIPCRHISQYETFEDFQQMARSSLNVVVTPLAVYAAKQWQARMGTDWILLPTGYDFDETDRQIAAVCEKLGLEVPDTSADRARAEAAIESAKTKLNGRRVSLDYSATYRPFGVAKLLAEHGIQVGTIFASSCIAADQPAMDWVLQNLDDVEILQPEHYLRVNGCTPDPDGICLGFECAYYLHCAHVIPIAADGDFYGYSGVVGLMQAIETACDRTYNLEQLVKDSGLVV